MLKGKTRRIVCYLLALIMALSCFTVTSYGLEGTEAGAGEQEQPAGIESMDESGADDENANESEAIEEPTDNAGGVAPAGLNEQAYTLSGKIGSAMKVSFADIKTVSEANGCTVIAEGGDADVSSQFEAVETDGVVTGFDVTIDASKATKYTVQFTKGGNPIGDSVVVDIASMAPDKPAIGKQIEKIATDKSGSKFTTKSFKNHYKYNERYSDPKITLSWTAPAQQPDEYYLYRNDSKFKTLDGDVTKYSFNESAGSRKYYVEAIYKDDGGNIASRVKSPTSNGIKMRAFLKCGLRTYKFYAKTNTKAKFYKQGSGQAYKRWLPKGVKGTCVGGSGSKFEFNTDKYGKGYVMRHKLTCYKVDYSPNVDWSKSDKEKFVNKGGALYKEYPSACKTSKNRLIWVSRYAQKINIFVKKNGKWELERSCTATTGEFRRYTSSGDYKIHTRTKYRPRSGYYYYYLSRYNGANSLHGPTYWKSSKKMKSSPSWHLGKTGMGTGTLGCVRTYNEDAYYIWTHTNLGYRVIVY